MIFSLERACINKELFSFPICSSKFLTKDFCDLTKPFLRTVMVRGSSDLISLSKVSSLTLPNLSNLVLLFPKIGSSLNFLIRKSISLFLSSVKI
jgi:hypothetical protein